MDNLVKTIVPNLLIREIDWIILVIKIGFMMSTILYVIYVRYDQKQIMI